MNFRIEVDAQKDEEVIIRCKKIDGRIERLQRMLNEGAVAALTLVFYRGDEEYYFSVEDIYFFETSGDSVFAHTAQDSYLVKQRLYELEQMLPRHFVRVSKGGILNAKHVFSLQKNLASTSLVKFSKGHKQVFVSRHYYSELKQRLAERGNL